MADKARSIIGVKGQQLAVIFFRHEQTTEIFSLIGVYFAVSSPAETEVKVGEITGDCHVGVAVES